MWKIWKKIRSILEEKINKLKASEQDMKNFYEAQWVRQKDWRIEI